MYQCCSNLIHLAENVKWMRLNVTCRTFGSCGQLNTKFTHYDVLGVTKEATTKDIREAFLKKSKECHPDLNRTDPNNHKRFVSVNEAYSVLSKPLSRIDYDASITQRRVYQDSVPQHNRYPYHYSRVDYDQQMHRARKARYEQQKMGFKYDSPEQIRASNSKVVVVCFVVMIVSAVIHYFIVRKISLWQKDILDKRDARAYELLRDARNQAKIYTLEDQIHILHQKHAKNMEKRHDLERK